MNRMNALSIGLVVYAIAALTTTACSQQETVTLNLTALTTTGQVLANAPFEAATTAQTGFAMTDANGQASFTLDVAEGETTVTVRMSAGGFTPIVPPNLR